MSYELVLKLYTCRRRLGARGHSVEVKGRKRSRQPPASVEAIAPSPYYNSVILLALPVLSLDAEHFLAQHCTNCAVHGNIAKRALRFFRSSASLILSTNSFNKIGTLQDAEIGSSSSTLILSASLPDCQKLKEPVRSFRRDKSK
jgi:hypothetical protein